MAGIKKTKSGVVISRKMDKTAVVEVARKIKHPHFKKYYVKRTKFKVHDAQNQTQAGDQVEIVESKPISKQKTWVVTKIIARGNLKLGDEVAV